jgi:hypothetical protein
MGAPPLRGGGSPYRLGQKASVPDRRNVALSRQRDAVGRHRAPARLTVQPSAGHQFSATFANSIYVKMLVFRLETTYCRMRVEITGQSGIEISVC